MTATEEKVPAAVLLKIRKLQELAQRGVGGEAINAQRVLDALCEKYGISLEQLEQEDKKKYVFPLRASVKTLFLHSFIFMFGANVRFKEDFCTYILGGKRFGELNLTAVEYIEFSQFWEWHRHNFLKERKRMRDTFESAYFSKHSLFTDDFSDEIRKMLDESEKPTLQEILAIQRMAENIEENTFHKQIGDKATQYEEEGEE